MFLQKVMENGRETSILSEGNGISRGRQELSDRRCNDYEILNQPKRNRSIQILKKKKKIPIQSNDHVVLRKDGAGRTTKKKITRIVSFAASITDRKKPLFDVRVKDRKMKQGGKKRDISS